MEPTTAYAASGAASAAASMIGQQSANQSNRDASIRNYEFQKHLSDTAIRRTTLDLEAAGLNRVLAAGGQPPAATPSLQQEQNQNIAGGAADAFSSTARAVMEKDRTEKEIEKVDAEIKAINTNTQNAKNAGKKTSVTGDMWQAIKDVYKGSKPVTAKSHKQDVQKHQKTREKLPAKIKKFIPKKPFMEGYNYKRKYK